MLCPRCRVFFLGERAVGKTSLIRTLLADGRPSPATAATELTNSVLWQPFRGPKDNGESGCISLLLPRLPKSPSQY